MPLKKANLGQHNYVFPGWGKVLRRNAAFFGVFVVFLPLQKPLLWKAYGRRRKSGGRRKPQSGQYELGRNAAESAPGTADIMNSGK